MTPFKMKRFWKWTILKAGRNCIICGGVLEGGQKALEADYRETITLSRFCREALQNADRLNMEFAEEPELHEAFDLETVKKRKRTEEH